MTNTDQNTQLKDESDETPVAETRAIWRRVGHGLARYVDHKVEALIDALDEAKAGEANSKQSDDGPLVRKISATVIAAQRTMELENSYGQKVQNSALSDAERDDAETARRIEKTLLAVLGGEDETDQEKTKGGRR